MRRSISLFKIILVVNLLLLLYVALNMFEIMGVSNYRINNIPINTYIEAILVYVYTVEFILLVVFIIVLTFKLILGRNTDEESRRFRHYRLKGLILLLIIVVAWGLISFTSNWYV